MSNSRPSLLVIPHQWSEKIRVRGIEYARHLHPFFSVRCLRWPDMFESAPNGSATYPMRYLRNGLLSLAPRIRSEASQDGIDYVRAPVLQTPLLSPVIGRTLAFRVSQRVNALLLKRLANRLRPDAILLGHGAFGFPNGIEIPIFFDWVDWYDESLLSRASRRHADDYANRTCRQTAGVITVSKPLAMRLAHRGKNEPFYLPNGADVVRFRHVNKGKVHDLRKRLGLEGKLVIGSVGHHGGAASGLDTLIEAFHETREAARNAILLIVGPADDEVRRRTSAPNSHIVFTGPIPPDQIPIYVQAIDIPVISKRKTPETDLAFHIKAVEYSAARKIIVSSPLEAVVELDWPHVVFADSGPSAWVRAIQRARMMRWQSKWDKIVDEYDWSRLAARMARFILERMRG